MEFEKIPRKLFDIATQVYFQTNQFEKHETDAKGVSSQ